jgi:hypothetical protein
VERNLQEIDRRVEQLKELHRKRLMVSFNDDNEQAKDREIEEHAKVCVVPRLSCVAAHRSVAPRQSITAIFHRGEKTLKLITNSVDFQSSDAEQKLRSNIVHTLASRLQHSSVQFRKTQKDFLKRRSQQKVFTARESISSPSPPSVAVCVCGAVITRARAKGSTF